MAAVNTVIARAKATEEAMLQALREPRDFDTFTGASQGANTHQRLITQRNILLLLNFRHQTFDVSAFVRTWLSEAMRICGRIFDFDGYSFEAENAWQFAFVFFKMRIFNDERIFDSPIYALHVMASVAPALLWRIITLHNCPHCPDWVDEKKWSGEFRTAMDQAATVEDKEYVLRIKAKLCDFFYTDADLDTPTVEQCEWLGLEEE